FGWRSGIDRSSDATAVMATYCWLRHPTDFRRAVESAAALGGDVDTLAAVVGGLAGAHLGAHGIPERWKRRLRGFPHGPEWIARMADRLADWPHGIDDLHRAPALPSDPPMQLLRNLLTRPLIW